MNIKSLVDNLEKTLCEISDPASIHDPIHGDSWINDDKLRLERKLALCINEARKGLEMIETYRIGGEIYGRNRN